VLFYLTKEGLEVRDELAELWDTAIYKEVASEALYAAAQGQTRDPGARELLKDLAGEEKRHAELLKGFREEGWSKRRWHRGKVPDLKVSEYLTGGDSLEGAGLQETLVFAMKREQQSLEFYARMMSVVRDRRARLLCQRLAREELRHKFRLETFYDSLFYEED